MLRSVTVWGLFLLFLTVKKGLRKDGAGNQHAQNRPSAHSWCDDQWLWWSESEVWIWGRSCLLPWLSLRQNQINTNVALWCYQPTSCHMQVLSKDGIGNVLLCMSNLESNRCPCRARITWLKLILQRCCGIERQHRAHFRNTPFAFLWCCTKPTTMVLLPLQQRGV